MGSAVRRFWLSTDTRWMMCTAPLDHEWHKRLRPCRGALITWGCGSGSRRSCGWCGSRPCRCLHCGQLPSRRQSQRRALQACESGSSSRCSPIPDEWRRGSPRGLSALFAVVSTTMTGVGARRLDPHWASAVAASAVMADDDHWLALEQHRGLLVRHGLTAGQDDETGNE
jgi:hypothetical protein